MDASDTSELYTALRIDFFRDDRVRMAIYSILNPTEMKIDRFARTDSIPIPTWIFPIDHILGEVRYQLSCLYVIFLFRTA